MAAGPAIDVQAVAAAVPPSSGSLQDYVIEKAIGRGHFSTVHRAVRRSDERRVALKKVQIFDMLDAKARDRCLKEVQLLKSLPLHPSIIHYLDSFIDNNEVRRHACLPRPRGPCCRCQADPAGSVDHPGSCT